MKKIFLLLFLIYLTPSIAQIEVEKFDVEADFSELIFFSDFYNDSYLINKCGDVLNKWEHDNRAGLTGQITPDGHLLRAGKTPSCCTQTSAGGLLELIDFDGEIVWSYPFATAEYTQHHDFYLMENGNILFLGWEVLSYDDKINLGRSDPSGDMWAEFVFEIKPVGSDDFELIWEWHMKDHLMQDQFPALDNYEENISDGIRKVDINYRGPYGFSTRDWWHVNAIDYNPERDEILLNSRNKGEFMIVDHSTSSAEAKTDAGGNSGLGGRLLFRWGNPEAYGAGDGSDIKMYGSHGHNWIKKGLPNEDYILFFNNGDQRAGGEYSTVEMVKPLVDANRQYVIEDNVFQTEDHRVVYGENQEEQPLFSRYMSNAQQLPSGHLLINEGYEGNMYEINNTGEVVWEMNYGDPIFKAFSYSRDYSGFAGLDLTTLSYGSPKISYDNLNVCVGPVELRAVPVPGDILWNTGDTTQYLIAEEEGLYSYSLDGDCKFSTQSISVFKESNLDIDISSSYDFLCQDSIELVANTDYQDIIWSTNESGPNIFIDAPTTYYYEAYDYCLESSLMSEVLDIEKLTNPESLTSEISYGEDAVIFFWTLYPYIEWYTSDNLEVEKFATGNSLTYPNAIKDSTFWMAWGTGEDCLSDRIPMYFKVKASSTKEEGKKSLLLKPNPITQNDLLVIDSELDIEEVQVVDLYGRALGLKRIGDGYSVKHLTPGLYIVLIKQRDGVGIGKLVVE